MHTSVPDGVTSHERQSQVGTLTDNLSYVLPEYDVVDWNADVRLDAMTVCVFVKNLTDERAFTGGGTTVDGLNFPSAWI